LIVCAEGWRAVRDVFLDEPLTVEDAAYVIREVDDCGVDAKILHPRDVLLDDDGIRAVIAAAHALHVGGLQEGPGRAALKGDRFRTEPGLVFHDHDMAVDAYD
jgi:hypothetical protein